MKSNNIVYINNIKDNIYNAHMKKKIFFGPHNKIFFLKIINIIFDKK